MTGGFINVKKNARDYVGSSMYGKKLGMNGGEILINGDSGNYTVKYEKRNDYYQRFLRKLYFIQNDLWKCVNI